MKNIRSIHKKVGLLLSPFFLLTGLTSIPLFFRKDDLYSKEVKSFLIGLHNGEIVAKYVGLGIALSFIFMSLSGLYMYFKNRRR